MLGSGRCRRKHSGRCGGRESNIKVNFQSRCKRHWLCYWPPYLHVFGLAPFRNSAIDKWQRKSQVTTGVAGFKGKLQAFSQNISEQVAMYMKDPSKIIKRMQLRRPLVGVFGPMLEMIREAQEEARREVREEARREREQHQSQFSESVQEALAMLLATLPPHIRVSSLSGSQPGTGRSGCPTEDGGQQ